MTHIELVTGKKIIVKETIHDMANMTKPTVRLTMISQKRRYDEASKRFVIGREEQEIFLLKDMIVYMYERGDILTVVNEDGSISNK